MGLGQRAVSDHCDRFFAHFPIPPVSSRRWAFITAEFLRQYLLSSARRASETPIAIATGSPPRSCRDRAKSSRQNEDLRPRDRCPRNRVALALQRKGQELATWCVLAWRRTRFFGMSPRGEIAFPMLLNKGNVPCTVKCQSGRGRARECSS